MSTKNIEQKIEEFYEYIEDCKPPRMTNIGNRSLIVVSKDEICDILDEMKLALPEEIGFYQKLLKRKDEIIAEAEHEAKRIISDAQEKAKMLVQDTEIVRQAYLSANEIMQRNDAFAKETVANANYEAQQIYNNAYEYTNQLLAIAESSLARAYEETRVRNEEMLETLRLNLETVAENRKELTDGISQDGSEESANPGEYSTAEYDENYQEDVENPYDENFEVNGNAFMENIDQ